jgi:hypothetical protein
MRFAREYRRVLPCLSLYVVRFHAPPHSGSNPRVRRFTRF